MAARAKTRTTGAWTHSSTLSGGASWEQWAGKVKPLNFLLRFVIRSHTTLRIALHCPN